MAGEHQKVTRDVLDLELRPIVYDGAVNKGGIVIDGSADPGGACSGSRFSIDAVPIGLSTPCSGRFVDLDVDNDLDVINDLTVGGTITATGAGASSVNGTLDMNGNRILQVADPVAGTDAVPLTFGDNRWVNVGGDTMTGFLFLNADPTLPLHAATRQWVLTQVSGLSSGFESGQVWGNYTGSRAFNTTYTNTTGSVMAVSVRVHQASSSHFELNINGQAIQQFDIDTIAAHDWISYFGIVPIGHTYRMNILSGSQNAFGWYELR